MKNKRVSKQREKQEQEAREAAESLHRAESSQRAEAEANLLRDSQETARLNEKVSTILESVNAAASGNLGVKVNVTGNDAIGQVGQAFDKLLATLRENFKEIVDNTQSLSEAACTLSSTSDDMARDADEATLQIEHIANSANEINADVQASAAATEQMTTAIQEVSQCVSDAVAVGQDAVVLAQEATTTVEQLGQSSTGIGSVLKVISTIAEQTNLLALNATIEAARAGDAGKGFAVVANEVKELAKETAKATDEISSRIQAIQSDASNANDVIGKISNIIEQIGGYQSTVAVEQQTATTSRISANVSNSAKGSDNINSRIATISEHSDRVQASSSHVEKSASTLSQISRHLKELLKVYELDGERAPKCLGRAQ